MAVIGPRIFAAFQCGITIESRANQEIIYAARRQYMYVCMYLHDAFYEHIYTGCNQVYGARNNFRFNRCLRLPCVVFQFRSFVLHFI